MYFFSPSCSLSRGLCQWVEHGGIQLLTIWGGELALDRFSCWFFTASYSLIENHKKSMSAAVFTLMKHLWERIEEQNPFGHTNRHWAEHDRDDKEENALSLTTGLSLSNKVLQELNICWFQQLAKLLWIWPQNNSCQNSKVLRGFWPSKMY